MMSQFPLFRKGAPVICLLAFLALIVLASGCTQPAAQQPAAPAPVTATQIDSGTIKIVYPGSTATSTLLELETTVTDSTGKSQTRSIGDRQSTTPLRFGATQTLTGSFGGNDHLLVTGYFMDGSRQHMLETTL